WLPAGDNPGRCAKFDGDIDDGTRGVVRRHEKGSAAMNRTAAVCRESACIASGTKSRSPCALGRGRDARSEWPRSFFERRDGLGILAGMTRAGADVRKANLLQ